jgi:hypothetical protein
MLPRSVQGSKFYETPQGYVLGKPLEGANDQGPKPVRLPSRQEQIGRGDAEFWARLEKEYEKVKIAARPMLFFGDFRSDIEKPDIAADEVRVRLMRHFPDGPRHGGDRAAGRCPLRQGAAEEP